MTVPAAASGDSAFVLALLGFSSPFFVLLPLFLYFLFRYVFFVFVEFGDGRVGWTRANRFTLTRSFDAVVLTDRKATTVLIQTMVGMRLPDGASAIAGDEAASVGRFDGAVFDSAKLGREG